jgi:tetratricopeptide (TPR) repeat protein
LFAISSWAWSASLNEARRLHQEGSVQEALAEIEKILGSDALDADKAQALDLLGDIAVDQGYLAMAKQAWSRLLTDYPDFVESTDAQTKLSLVSALLGAESDDREDGLPVAAEPVAPEKTPAPPPPVVKEPEMKMETAPAPPDPAEVVAVETEAAPDVEPTTTVAPPAAPPMKAADDSGLVLVAVQGKPHDAAQEASDRIVEYLRERGVDAVSATGGIPVVQKSDMVLPLLLQKGQEDGASSLLLLTAEFANMQKMALKCYLPEGAELWKLKVSGGTGTTGREWSKTGINYKLVERFEQKLEPRIGGPGLPVTLD